MLKGYVSNLTRATLIPLPPHHLFSYLPPYVCLPVDLSASVRQLINSLEKRKDGKGEGTQEGG